MFFFTLTLTHTMQSHLLPHTLPLVHPQVRELIAVFAEAQSLSLTSAKCPLADPSNSPCLLLDLGGSTVVVAKDNLPPPSSQIFANVGGANSTRRSLLQEVGAVAGGGGPVGEGWWRPLCNSRPKVEVQSCSPEHGWIRVRPAEVVGVGCVGCGGGLLPSALRPCRHQHLMCLLPMPLQGFDREAHVWARSSLTSFIPLSNGKRASQHTYSQGHLLLPLTCPTPTRRPNLVSTPSSIHPAVVRQDAGGAAD